MSEEMQSKLEALKDRADLLGIKYHPNISEEKLEERVKAALDDAPKDAQESPAAPAKQPAEAAAPKLKTPEETANQRRVRKKKEAEALVRVRVTCMNPNKKEWDGEIITAGNNMVGTIRKMVPFNEVWHVPRMILNVMRDRQCQVFVTVRDDKGRKVRKGKLIKEFAIEELPPLTEDELKKLAQRQAMARGES